MYKFLIKCKLNIYKCIMHSVAILLYEGGSRSSLPDKQKSIFGQNVFLFFNVLPLQLHKFRPTTFQLFNTFSVFNFI